MNIEWGDPQGHLGGVWMPGSSTIILNAARLDCQTDQTHNVLLHEIAHVHQNWIIAAQGMTTADFQARMEQIFGAPGIESAADAVAVLLGATTVYYRASFSQAELDAAQAIINNQLP
jgi:predicted SprT family Zn-dependent metalloprotease